MMKKYLNLNILVYLIAVLFLITGVSFADMADKITNEVPESWFEAPKTAENMDISEFNQSPILDERVENGELPEVKERLPEDPPVIEPMDGIGEYGGTHKVMQDSLDSLTLDADDISDTMLFRPDPHGTKLLPSLAKSYEYNEDYTAITINLREGMKWSDGEAFNVDDFVFWWEAELQNEDLNPITPENWKPTGWEALEKIDDYTFEIQFTDPNPLFMGNIWSQLNWFMPGIPEHYLKQFHPDYTEDSDELDRLIEKEGFDAWYEFYEYVKETGRNQTDYPVPTLGAYLVKESSSDSLLLERNPYTPFVDPEGNQLPYIDEMRIDLVQDWEVYNAQVATGEATTGVHRVSASQVPMLKNYSEKENFNLFMGQKVHSAQVHLMPNMTHKDEQLREILQESDFRRALSSAINREEINQTFYFGLGESSAVTAHPTSPYYKEEYQKYVEFDPEKANELLDGIGMVDSNGDGQRDFPNGDSFKLTIEYVAYQDVVPKMLEMITAQWQEEVNLNIETKEISYQLWSERAQSNDLDMTVWAVDPVGSLTFPASEAPATNFAPISENPHYGSQWMAWCRWNATDGDEGEEPPEDIKQLISRYEKALQTTDEEERIELIQDILDVNAEEVWTIGTIGRWQSPRIVNQNLKNVPESFIMGHSTDSGYQAYYPDTWYFVGGEAAE